MSCSKISLPKISVIVPIYKVEKYIRKCAQSLFAQTLDEIEFIFVDDCTPDDSIAILLSVLDEYPHRKRQVRVLRHECNKGLTNARNTGIDAAQGEFIAHCDSDDWVNETMYEKLYNEARKSKSDVVLCDISMVELDGTTVFKTAAVGNNNIATLNNYIVLPWTCTVNMIVSRRIYDRYQIKSPIEITYCEDYHLTVRLLYYSDKITKVNEPLYFYNRLNDESITHNLNSKQREERYKCDLEIISFFINNNVLSFYERSLAIRILSYSRFWVLDRDKWDKFRTFFPPSHKYIKSIGNVRFWHKLLMRSVAGKKNILATMIYTIWLIKYKSMKTTANHKV